jgi:aldehyde dehydrogenase (NAD+)
METIERPGSENNGADRQTFQASTAPAPARDAVADVKRVFALQQTHRWTMARTTAAERIGRLHRLQDAILAHRSQLYAAVHADFRKAALEFDVTELMPTLLEIKHTITHLDGWLSARRVGTPLVLAGTHSEIRYEPRGVVCILAPWNYPFFLLVPPLVSAVASGDCVMLRPSDKVPRTSQVLKAIVATAFDEREVALFTGGYDVADALLDLPFDHFFFTGSTRIAKKVMAKAAEHLATVTLELGGKSPAIIDETADVRAAAHRVTWGKLINAGQTCLAPDYVLVHEKVRNAFIEAAKQEIEKAYGSTEEARRHNPDFARIIDAGAFGRIRALLDGTIAMGARVEIGGLSDAADRYIAPTILSGVTPSAPIMREEIFGPVLPVLTWRTLDEALAVVHRLGKPLALYVFSRREANVEEFLRATTAGGTTVNNTVIHVANPELPFGGVGSSGQGSYHGEAGIRAFSHERSILRQGRLEALRLLHPPYGPRTRAVLSWVERLFT